MAKSCHHCGEEILVRKNGVRYCRNGCDICTAMPQGEGFTVRQRGVPDEVGWTRLVAGGLRRSPTCKD